MWEMAGQWLERRHEWRQQLEQYVENARDRLFRAEQMVVAGQTPFTVVHDDGLVKLRHYTPLTEPAIEVDGRMLPVSPHRQRVPLVIVPPLAVNMLIYDLFPHRSLVRYLLARGFDVYLIDWGVPGRRHAHYNLHTYVAELLPQYLARVRAHSGQQELSLHGWSMGGMFTLFYLALTGDPLVRNAVILGTPVDSHASGAIGKMYQRLHQLAELVREHTGFRIHKLNPKWLHTPGWMNVIGFKLTNPIGSVMGYWELLTRFGDRDFVESHATQSAFLDRMVAYPGGIVQDTFVRVWIDNELSRGGMKIGDRAIDLAHIRTALLALAGQSDTMVTPAAADKLLDVVASTDKQFAVVPGGHMGILSGSQAPAMVWPQVADWLVARSH